MSRAVVTCSGSGRPEALRNCVAAMPSWRAFCVISWAKRASLPAMCSATATATSLADLVISALMASIRSISAPSSTSSLVGAAIGRVGGEADLGAVAEPALLDRLEDQVQRHQLGERGREPQLVGGDLVQHAARVGVDHEHRMPACNLRVGRRQQAPGARTPAPRQQCRADAQGDPMADASEPRTPFPRSDACGPVKGLPPAPR